MRKLTLDLDRLAVESFETAESVDAAGTVRANAADSEGCTYFCTCTCTLEGLCCGGGTMPMTQAETQA